MKRKVVSDSSRAIFLMTGKSNLCKGDATTIEKTAFDK